MGELDWKPNRGPQAAFLMCPVPEILYGGAKGGGKSDAIGPWAVRHVKMYGQHATVLILRETMPQLRDLIRRVRPHCLREGARFNKVEKTWVFPNGGQIVFGHLSEGCDPYWGQEYSAIVVDEVTRCLPTEVDYLELLGSLRNSHGVPCSVVLTSNPGGKGHEWVKARFMNVPPLTVQGDPATGLERVFIPASLRDNRHLPASYRAQLEQLPDAERRAFLDGDWAAFEGQVFKLTDAHKLNWERFNALHGLPSENRAIPASWNRYRSYDHGYARPGACYWYAVDPDGRAYVYREYYTVARDSRGATIPNEGARHEPRHVARRIAELSEGERYQASWTGPDLFFEVRQDQAGGIKISSHFEAEKLFFTAWRANAGSRLAGKQALHQRLSIQPDGLPALMFIEPECPHAIRTLATLDYDERDPEQVDTDGEDHAYDSLSGFCKMQPWAPVSTAKPVTGWRERQSAAESYDWMTS